MALRFRGDFIDISSDENSPSSDPELPHQPKPKSHTAYIIGQTIRDMRKEANISQEELADRIGSQKSYISRVENGKIDISFDNLVDLFRNGFGKSVSLFLKELADN